MSKIETVLLEKLIGVIDIIIKTEEEALAIGNLDDISRTEMQTLIAIGPYDKLSMSAVADKVGVTAGTLTVQVKKLRKKGYLDKTKNKDDKRISELSLTRKGKIAVRLHQRSMRAVMNAITEPLTEEQTEFMAETLDKVYEYMQATYKEYKDKERAKERNEKFSDYSKIEETDKETKNEKQDE